MSSKREKTSPEILLVNRNQDERKLLINALVGQGYNITHVPSINEASAIIPDLIIISLNAEESSCHEVCYQLKARENTEEIPVLIISDQKNIMGQLEGLPGAFDITGSSYSREELLMRVKNL